MTLTEQTVRSLGIPGTYMGFRYMVRALELACQDEDRLLRVTKEIYPVIAEEFGTTQYCVEKDLRTAIGICWSGAGRARLETVCRYPLSARPRTGEFLDIVTSYLKKQEVAV